MTFNTIEYSEDRDVPLESIHSGLTYRSASFVPPQKSIHFLE
jgi:hypothetical protein